MYCLVLKESFLVMLRVPSLDQLSLADQRSMKIAIQMLLGIWFDLILKGNIWAYVFLENGAHWKSKLSKYSFSPICNKNNQRDLANFWHRKLTLKIRIVLYFTFNTKSMKISKIFVWSFTKTFGLTYSPLNSAKLSFSSEVTLWLD